LKATKGCTDLFGTHDASLNEEPIELAALAKNGSAEIVRILFGLGVSGEFIEVRVERAAPEINAR